MVMSAIGVVLHSAMTSFSGVRYTYSLASVAYCSQKRGPRSHDLTSQRSPSPSAKLP